MFVFSLVLNICLASQLWEYRSVVSSGSECDTDLEELSKVWQGYKVGHKLER